jgi:hypothetical protein
MVRDPLSGLLNRPGGIRKDLGCSWNRAAGLCVIVMLTLLVTGNHRIDANASEWELTSVVKPVLTNMNVFLNIKSAASKFSRCDASVLKLEGSDEPLLAVLVNSRFGINGTDVSSSSATAIESGGKHSALSQHFKKATVLSAPCG